MLLEVIASSVEDIKLINESNTDRIEFCFELTAGGFTPDYEAIVAGVQLANVPVNVMCRRTNGNFTPSEIEFDQLLLDAEFIGKTNANGIVIGVITENKEVDIERMKQIIAVANGKKIIFHKAFDEINDKLTAVKQLEALNISTILTAGGLEKIEQNLSTLTDLKLNSKIEILAGGGVDFKNVEIIKNHVDSIHVGTAVRMEKSWDVPISVKKINQLKKLIK